MLSHVFAKAWMGFLVFIYLRIYKKIIYKPKYKLIYKKLLQKLIMPLNEIRRLLNFPCRFL